jgi:hypothetical protein
MTWRVAGGYARTHGTVHQRVEAVSTATPNRRDVAWRFAPRRMAFVVEHAGAAFAA